MDDSLSFRRSLAAGLARMTACRRKALLVLAAGVALLVFPAVAPLFAWDIGNRAQLLLGVLGISGVLAASTMWWSIDLQESAPRALRQRYFREFFPPMLGYGAVMMCWKPLLASVDATWLRVLVALLPALLVLLTLRATMRYVRDSDEMQRRIELESIAIGAGLTSAVFLTAGFLQSARLIAAPAATAMLLVFPTICVGYGVAKLFIARRCA